MTNFIPLAASKEKNCFKLNLKKLYEKNATDLDEKIHKIYEKCSLKNMISFIANHLRITEENKWEKFQAVYFFATVFIIFNIVIFSSPAPDKIDPTIFFINSLQIFLFISYIVTRYPGKEDIKR